MAPPLRHIDHLIEDAGAPPAITVCVARDGRRRPDAAPAPAAAPPEADHTPPPRRALSLALRPLEESDRDEFCRVLRISRGSIAQHVPVAAGDEPEETVFEQWLTLTEQTERDLTSRRRIAVATRDHPGGPRAGTILGSFNLTNIDRGLEWTADANWWVAADQRGRGVATTAVRMMLDHALAPLPEGLGLTRVTIGIEPRNAASRRVAARCGFVECKGPGVYLDKGEEWSKHDLFDVIAGR